MSDTDYWKSKHKDPAFIAERDRWYAKAAKAGFVDLEPMDKLTKEPSKHMLKGMSQGDLRRGLYKPEVEEFFSLARKWFWRIKGDDWQVHRRIWGMYMEGLGMAQAHRTLRAEWERGGRKGKKPTYGYVRWVVQYETKRMLEAAMEEVNDVDEAD